MARPSTTMVHAAATQARAEYQPQIRGVRRGARSQIKSIRSMSPALTASLQLAAKQLRSAGLSPRDLAIAESEYANRIADVGASTALQEQQVHQQAHGEVKDLLTSEGQAQSSALATLLHEAAQRRQDLAAEKAAEVRQFKLGLAQAQAEKQLGVGSYYESPKDQAELGKILSEVKGGGLTPTQQRAAHADHQNASFYAKQLFQAAKAGEISEVDPNPHNWDETMWSHMVGNVAKSANVDVPVAERAVDAIKAHVQGAGSGDLMQMLRNVASVALPAVAPKSLQPIAQLGSAALRR